MDNIFITKPPFHQKKDSVFINFINKSFRFVKARYSIQMLPDPAADMNTIEQRINYFHLLNTVISHDIPGDVIELGCFTGQCAMLFQKIIQMNGSQKQLHLYDSFESKFKIVGSIETALHANFRNAGLELPILHKGFFQKTIPEQLPEKISFVHIDCGSGGDPLIHKATIIYCLESVYYKMSNGAICVLMDYHDDTVNNIAYNVNPGVKLGCGEFLSDKPEKMISLYGNQYSHGYFRKI